MPSTFAIEPALLERRHMFPSIGEGEQIGPTGRIFEVIGQNPELHRLFAPLLPGQLPLLHDQKMSESRMGVYWWEP